MKYGKYKFPSQNAPEGNIFSIIGQARKAMQKGGAPKEEVDKMTAEVQASHSYEAAKEVIRGYVNCSN